MLERNEGGAQRRHSPFMHNLFCLGGRGAKYQVGGAREKPPWCDTIYLGYRGIFIIWSYLDL